MAQSLQELTRELRVISKKEFPLIKVSGSGADRADISFNINEGYAYFKPSDYNFTIELAAINKE